MEDYKLKRFLDAQQNSYETAVAEVQAGRKQSHWMWYIFPQIQGLGSSEMSQRYAIRDLEEANLYLAEPLLGIRLISLCNELLKLSNLTATEIFGYPDNMKLRSSMTLFAQVGGEDSVFELVLRKYYGGVKDAATLQILSELSS